MMRLQELEAFDHFKRAHKCFFGKLTVEQLKNLFDNYMYESDDSSLEMYCHLWSVSRMVRNRMRRTRVSTMCSDGFKKQSLYSGLENCLQILKRHLVDIPSSRYLDFSEFGGMSPIEWQVDNLLMLLEVMVQRSIAEDFVMTWGSQLELSSAHSLVPVTYRFQISVVTARLLMEISRGNILLSKDAASALLRTCLGPLCDDYHQLVTRSSKADGIEFDLVQEGLRRTILVLPLSLQQEVLSLWCERFVSSRRDCCPDLQGALEFWWTANAGCPATKENPSISGQI